ncbi:MAG: hypothetical protein Q8K78_07290 [Planctomycetaceae bacterium]|nr:hypothetical protein [Planctomycetaceae bacterium]
MQRSWAVMITAALVLASGVSAMAQPPRGGGRGFGGGGGFGGPAFLVAMEAVQKELAVTDAQKEKLDKLREEARAGFGGGGNPRDLSDEERAKLRTQMEERTKKTEESLKAILDEKQHARLNQLVIQQAGVMALSRPDVAEKLKLTDEQKTKLREVAEAGRGAGGRGGFNPNASQEERQKAMEEARARREKTTADAMAVLNADQKKAFEDMQGKKFEFPAFGGFGGGNRPGGNRPPRDAN